MTRTARREYLNRMRVGVSSRTSIILLLVVTALIAPDPARAKKLQWAKRLGKCEPPAVFYSPAHRPGNLPCCPTVEGVCSGGSACPASGVCPGDGKLCAPAPIAPRPNVVLLISDDQGYCDYGTAGECRSVQSGTPIPPPSTPNLDLLAGYGTEFPHRAQHRVVVLPLARIDHHRPLPAQLQRSRQDRRGVRHHPEGPAHARR